MIERHAIYQLRDGLRTFVIVLSYPGIELSGAVIVAPLLKRDEISVVPILHPVISTQIGERVIAMERMAAVSRHLLGETFGAFDDTQFLIYRALSRLFNGN